MTSASVLAVLRSNLSVYVFFVYTVFFSIACFVNSSVEVTFWIALVYSPSLICGFLLCKNQNDVYGKYFREPNNAELVILPTAVQ
jgi:hypothetical protein